MKFLPFLILLLYASSLAGQSEIETQEKEAVEPVYVDFASDLNNEKGALEGNLSYGLANYKSYLLHQLIAELEYGLFENFGVELELPFNFFSSIDKNEAIPPNQLESIELTFQYTFFNHIKKGITLAAAAGFEPELAAFADIPDADIIEGFSASFSGIGSKKWNDHFYSTIITGPEVALISEDELENADVSAVTFDLNLSTHYLFESGSFTGIEFNSSFNKAYNEMVIRPQAGFQLSENVLIASAVGIPLIKSSEERESLFIRFVIEN